MGVRLANAANYHVDANNGSDDNDGRNEYSAWRSIARVNSAMGQFQPGDQILFRAGQTFSGELQIRSSGASNQPLVFSSYGNGNKPILSGLQPLQGWFPSAWGIWSVDCPNCPSTLNTVVMNGKNIGMGRYPNLSDDRKGYLTLEYSNAPTNLHDNELNGDRNWTGAEVVVRKNHWVLDRGFVTGHYNQNLNFTSDTLHVPGIGYGYFFQNSFQTLDQQNEWYFDQGQRKFHMYQGVWPSDVSVAVVENVVSIVGAHEIVIRGLNMQGANTHTIDIAPGSSNISIQQSEVGNAGVNGINAMWVSHLEVWQTVVRDSNNIGIRCAYCPNVRLIENTVQDSGTIPGMGVSNNQNYEGIYVNGDDAVVSANNVLRSGYIGINYHGNRNLITKNYVDAFNMSVDDGGGIYGWGDTRFSGTEISNNVILNGIGVLEGTTDAESRSSPGIYLDEDSSKDVLIANNTVAHCNGPGLYIHDSLGNRVMNNTFFDNSTQISTSHDTNQVDIPVNSMHVTNNIFFPKTAAQDALSLYTFFNHETNFGTNGYYDSNFFGRPLGSQFMIKTYDPVNGAIMYDLQKWRSTYGFEQQGRVSAQLPAFRINQLLSGNLVDQGTFDNNTSEMSCLVFTSSCYLSNDAGKLDNGTLRVNFSGNDTTVNVMKNLGTINAGKNYILRFSSMGNMNRALRIYIRENSGSYYFLTSGKDFAEIGTSRRENEMLLPTVASGNNATLVFEFQGSEAPIWLDNIQLFEADVTPTNPDDVIRFEYNQYASTRRVNLGGNYTDVKGNFYSGSVDLAPHSSVVLIKSDSQSRPSDAVVGQPSAQSSELPGQHSSTFVNANGYQYSVTANGEVRRNEEIIAKEGFSQIAVIGNGAVYGMTSNGSISRHIPNMGWESMTDGGAMEFSITDEGYIFVKGGDGNIYFALPHGGWRGPFTDATQALQQLPQLPGIVSSLSQSSNGFNYTVGGGGDVSRNDEIVSSPWILQIAIANDGNMFALGIDGSVYKALPHQNWRRVTNAYIVRFSIGNDNLIYAIGTDGVLYFTPENGEWMPR